MNNVFTFHMNETVYYPDQKKGVQLHDRVKYRVFYFFPWREAVVTYVPNISEFREDMLDGGMQCIGITTQKSGSELAYLIDHENSNVVIGLLKFVKQGDAD